MDPCFHRNDNKTGFSDETLDVIDNVRIIQKKKGHRFTTDSLILASLSSPKRYGRVLELGAGCGIVSILIAKRLPSIHITAVEIQPDIAGLAKRNILLNDLETRITILNTDVKKLPRLLPAAHFDYVVTNPPYRHPSTCRTSPDITRAISSQELTVTIRDIMRVSRCLLKVRGRLSIIYATERLVDLFSVMRTYRIEPKQMRCIHTRKEGEAPIIWLEGVREGRPGLKLKGFSP